MVVAERYARVSRRQVQAGDRLKDPRGVRIVADVAQYGYRLEPDARNPYEFMRNWPKVGRLKVLR